MSSQRSEDTLWVIVESRKQEFAVPAAYVREIVTMPEITAVPLCGARHRGVITLRGSVLPLLDMRKHFGWQSIPEELEDFYQLMGLRERDHRNWLAALEKSVADNTEFGLARDPHNCAFGKWYYAYKSDSPWISALLRKFEVPHNRIHALASAVDELRKNGENGEAQRLIEGARNGVLQKMISLFGRIKDLMRETARELAMVIATPQGTFAVSIDTAVAVEKVAPDSIEEVETGTLSQGSRLVHRAVKRKSNGGLAMILEPDALRAGAA